MTKEYLVSDVEPGMVLMEVSSGPGNAPSIIYWVVDVVPDPSLIQITYHLKVVSVIRSGYQPDEGWGEPIVIRFNPSDVFSPNARDATPEERAEFDAPQAAEVPLPRMVWRQFGKQACLVTVPADEPLKPGDVPFKF